MNAKSKKLIAWSLILLLWSPLAILVLCPLLVDYLSIPAFKVLGIYLGSGFICFVFFKTLVAPLWITALRRKECKKVARRMLIQLAVFLTIIPLISISLSFVSNHFAFSPVEKMLVEKYSAKPPYGDSRIKRALYLDAKFRFMVNCELAKRPFFSKTSDMVTIMEKVSNTSSCTNQMLDSIAIDFNSTTWFRLKSEGGVDLSERKQEVPNTTPSPSQ